MAAIKSCHPDQLRISALLWTRSAVQELIERECSVRLDLSTVGRYLARWRFTLKRASKRALEADPVVVEAWLADVYPQIKARAGHRVPRPAAALQSGPQDLPDLRQPLHPPRQGPELNPDEYLNQDVKRHMRQLHPRPVDKPGLKAEVRRFLQRRQRQPHVVRNYFQAPEIRYAA